MSRFLVVAPPFAGHVSRIVPFAAELAERGHAVTWATFPGLVGRLLPEGADVVALPERPARAIVEARRRHATTRSPAALALGSVDEMLVPLAEATLGAVEAAVDATRADVVVADVACLAGGLAARARDLPWATVSEPGVAVLGRTEPLRRHASARLADIQRRYGLEPVERPHWSPHLVLVNSVRAFVGDAELDEQVRLVGATSQRRRPDVPFPWERLRDAPIVYVTLGTTVEHLGARFLRTLADALADEPVQVVLAASPGTVSQPPANALVQAFVPQERLLERASLVVCQCGHTTLVEALVRGRPIVAAPIAYEQPWNAARVVAAGAGVRVRFRRATAAELREAVRAVLAEGRFAEAARALGRELSAAGGGRAGADALERLASAGFAAAAQERQA